MFDPLRQPDGPVPAPADPAEIDVTRLPVVAPPPRIDGVLVGTLRGFAPSGEPLVEHPASHAGAPLPARSTVALCPKQAGRPVVLMFEAGDPRRPVVLGLIQEPKPAGKPCGCGGATGRPEATADGERLVFEADKEIVLRCGAASITLTRAGKIILSGAYVLSRSTGVNKIKGGSVQIN